MAAKAEKQDRSQADDFASAAQEAQPGFLAEFWDFLIHNKKWWLTPIIIVLVLMALLVVFAPNSPLAPFIYTVF